MMPEREAKERGRHMGGRLHLAEGTKAFGCKPANLPTFSRKCHSQGRSAVSGGVGELNQSRLAAMRNLYGGLAEETYVSWIEADCVSHAHIGLTWVFVLKP